MKKIRKQFSHKKIVNHWLDFLINTGKFDSLEDLENCCFACGWQNQLEKAHIISLDSGGKDEIWNIHLLCADCHFASEYLNYKDYWIWFKYRNQMSLLQQLASYGR